MSVSNKSVPSGLMRKIVALLCGLILAPSSAFAVGACGIFAQDSGFGADYSNPSERKRLLDREKFLLSKDYISGFTLYLTWRGLQKSTTDGFLSYDFSIIDQVLDEASLHGKSVAIGIIVASYSPEVVKRDCNSFRFTHPLASVGLRTAPVPWTSCYFKYYDNFVEQLGRHINGNRSLRYVNISGPSTLFGLEVNWVAKAGSIKGQADNSSNVEISVGAFERGWRRSIDVYFKSFPDTNLALSLGVPLINGIGEKEAGAVSRRVRDYALFKVGQSNGERGKLIVRLLGLGSGDMKRFVGVKEESESQPTDYVSMAWEIKDVAPLVFEWGEVSTVHGRSNSYILNTLNVGASWGASGIEIKYPDVLAYGETFGKQVHLMNSLRERCN